MGSQTRGWNTRPILPQGRVAPLGASLLDDDDSDESESDQKQCGRLLYRGFTKLGISRLHIEGKKEYFFPRLQTSRRSAGIALKASWMERARNFASKLYLNFFLNPEKKIWRSKKKMGNFEIFQNLKNFQWKIKHFSTTIFDFSLKFRWFLKMVENFPIFFETEQKKLLESKTKIWT